MRQSLLYWGDAGSPENPFNDHPTPPLAPATQLSQRVTGRWGQEAASLFITALLFQPPPPHYFHNQPPLSIINSGAKPQRCNRCEFTSQLFSNLLTFQHSDQILPFWSNIADLMIIFLREHESKVWNREMYYVVK